MSRLFRTDLRDAVWDELARLAEEAGVSIGVYGKRVLTAHAEAVQQAEGDETETPSPVGTGSVMTEEAWRALTAWLFEKSLTPERVMQHFEYTTRAQVLDWAKTKGYEA